MTLSVLPSVLCGAALALANVAAAGVLLRMARGRSQQVFVSLVFGGMALRMMVVLAAVGLALAFAPVDSTGFVAGFLAVFALGLALETVLASRAARA